MAEEVQPQSSPTENPPEPLPATKNDKPKEKSTLAGDQERHMDVLAGAQSLLTVVVLALCCVISFSSRLFAIIRFESIIHEFDPW